MFCDGNVVAGAKWRFFYPLDIRGRGVCLAKQFVYKFFDHEDARFGDSCRFPAVGANPKGLKQVKYAPSAFCG